MNDHNWRKSAYSGEAANCIHIAAGQDGTIKIRESDTPNTVITTTTENLRAFILGVKAGEFDHFTE